MSDFDGWASNGGLDVKKFPMSNIYKDTDTRVACAAWDFQQAKIDELQARVDEAMKYVSESPLKDVSRRAMINFMDILKGNTNDH